MREYTVNYSVSPPIAIAPDYAKALPVDITISRDESGKMTGFAHRFLHQSPAPNADVIGASEAELRCLVAAIRYQSGQAPSIVAGTVTAPSDGTTPAQTFGQRKLGISAVLANTVPPPSTAVISGTPDRLGVWLELACLADQATDPAAALRLYGLIYEDLRTQPVYTPVPEDQDIWASRNFVSHATVDKRSMAPWLAKHFGVTSVSYDPKNSQHASVVASHRAIAKARLASLLGTYL